MNIALYQFGGQIVQFLDNMKFDRHLRIHTHITEHSFLKNRYFFLMKIFKTFLVIFIKVTFNQFIIHVISLK